MIKYKLRSQQILPIGKRESFEMTSEECILMKAALEQAEEDLTSAIQLLEIAFKNTENNKNIHKHIYNFLNKFQIPKN